MPPDSQRQTASFNDPISGDRAEQLAIDLGHQKSRMAIQEVVKEYVDSSEFAIRVKGVIDETADTVPFMKKVQIYADGQIDTRLFRNVKVVISLLVSWIASIVVAVIIAKIT